MKTLYYPAFLFSVLSFFPITGVDAAGTNVLRIAWNAPPKCATNPFLAYVEEDYIFINHLYEPLCVGMIDGSVKPWIAKSWEFNAKDNTWTFVLDKRAKWSDGKPLTARDVKFTFEAAYKNNFPIGAPSKDFVAAIDAVNEYTVKVKMAKSYADFVKVFGGTIIMPEHIWSKVDSIAKEPNPNPVGSGPFILKEYKQGAFMHLVKNKNYWQALPAIDELLIQIIPDPSAAVMALKKGEIDVLPDLSGNETVVPSLLQDPNIEVRVDKWFHTFYLAPNHRVKPLDLPEVRRAVDIAINKKRIVDLAMSGYAELPQMGYVPRALAKWAHPNLSWRGLGMSEEERLKEANAVLDSLGFTKGKDGIRTTKEGKRIVLRLGTLSSYPAYVRAAGFIQEDLGKIGMKVDVMAMEPQSLIPGLVFSGTRNHDWEFYLCGSNLPGIDRFAQEYAPANPSRWECGPAFGWQNKEVISLLQKSNTEMDENKRQQLLFAAQESFAKDLAVVTLAHRVHVTAYRKDRFTGWANEKIGYANMFTPLASTVNLLSLKKK